LRRSGDRRPGVSPELLRKPFLDNGLNDSSLGARNWHIFRSPHRWLGCAAQTLSPAECAVRSTVASSRLHCRSGCRSSWAGPSRWCIARRTVDRRRRPQRMPRPPQPRRPSMIMGPTIRRRPITAPATTVRARDPDAAHQQLRPSRRMTCRCRTSSPFIRRRQSLRSTGCRARATTSFPSRPRRPLWRSRPRPRSPSEHRRA